MVLTHTANLSLLMSLAAINGTAAALSGPATGALIREVVPADQLREANVVSRLGQNGALLSGMAVAGIISATLGPGVGLAIDALTFLVAGIAYSFIPVTAPQPTPSNRPSMLQDLRSGLGYVIQVRWISAWVGLILVLQISDAGGLMVLGPAVADSTFGRMGFGLIIAMQLFGTIVGAAVASSVQEPARVSVAFYTASGLALPLLLLAACALGAGGVSALILASATGVAMFLGGFLVELSLIWADVAVQRHVAPELLGRVLSYGGLASIGGIPVGELVVGPLASIHTIASAYVGLALCLILCLAVFARTAVNVPQHPVGASITKEAHTDGTATRQ